MVLLNSATMHRMSGCLAMIAVSLMAACGGGTNLTSVDANLGALATEPSGIETTLAATSEFPHDSTHAALLHSDPRAQDGPAAEPVADDSKMAFVGALAGVTSTAAPSATAAKDDAMPMTGGSAALAAADAKPTVKAPAAPPAMNMSDDMSGMDMSGVGPVVDKSKIPPRAMGHATARIRSVWRNISTGVDCVQGSPNCGVAPSNLPGRPNPKDIGAFRVVCGFANMAYDDPIVFPGQPGRSHLHTFFGNAGVDAFTTTASILTGNSTCAGGILNRSSYWVPTMIDTTDGTPLVPTLNNVYYKCSYALPLDQSCDQMQPLPTGLRMIVGNAKNTNPKSVGAKYICYGPHGENPGWKNTITDAFKDGTCVPGGDFVMAVIFPNCWDGVNLDSPNHSSHIVNSQQFQHPNGQWDRRCPVDHPVVLPVVAYNIHYKPVHVDKWRLSSDMYDPSLPAGLSGHGDYFMGWDEKTMQTFITNCDRAHRDCHDFLLGDGTTLY